MKSRLEKESGFNWAGTQIRFNHLIYNLRSGVNNGVGVGGVGIVYRIMYYELWRGCMVRTVHHNSSRLENYIIGGSENG